MPCDWLCNYFMSLKSTVRSLWETLLGQFFGRAAASEPISMGATAPTAPNSASPTTLASRDWNFVLELYAETWIRGQAELTKWGQNFGIDSLSGTLSRQPISATISQQIFGLEAAMFWSRPCQEASVTRYSGRGQYYGVAAKPRIVTLA